MGQQFAQAVRTDGETQSPVPAPLPAAAALKPAEKIELRTAPTLLPLTAEQRRTELMNEVSGAGIPAGRDERETFTRKLLDLSPADRGLVITAAYFNKEVAQNVADYARGLGPANQALLKENDGRPITDLADANQRPSIQEQKKIDDFSRELLKLAPGERVQALFSRLHGAKAAEDIFEAAKLIGPLGTANLNQYHVTLANYLADSISAKHEQSRSMDGRTILAAAALMQEVTPSGHTEITWAVEDALRIKKGYAEADAKVNEGISYHHKRVEKKDERYKAVADYFGEQTASWGKSYNARDSVGMKIITLGSSDGEKYLAKLVRKNPGLDPRTVRHAANCLDSGSIPLTDTERSAYAEQVALERKPKESVIAAYQNPLNHDMAYRLEALQGKHAIANWITIDGKTEGVYHAPIQPYDLRNTVNYPTAPSEDPVLASAPRPAAQPITVAAKPKVRPLPASLPAAPPPAETEAASVTRIEPPKPKKENPVPLAKAETVAPVVPRPAPAETIVPDALDPATIKPAAVEPKPPASVAAVAPPPAETQFQAQTPQPAITHPPVELKPVVRPPGRLQQILFGSGK